MWMILSLLALIAVGVPISISLGLTGLAYFFLNDLPLVSYAQRFAVGLDNFSLLAAPFFILVGVIMNRSQITHKIFRLANSIVGRIPGGLAHVNVIGSTIFAGMSGTAIADAAGLGAIEIEAMTQEGYDIEFSTAVTAASAVIGPIIPPSTVMVMYGVTANVSVSKLFLGGILPGLLISVVLMGLVFVYSIKRKYPRSAKFHFKVFWASLKDSFLALLTPLIIVGGILSGIMTATESGAIAAVYALLCGIYAYKTIKWSDLPGILWETALTCGVILVIVSTASIFGWCLTFEKIPQTVVAALTTITKNKTIMLLLITAIYLFLGMIMETAAIILTTVPIIVPIALMLGIDLVHLGVLIAILMSIGTITPPVGTVLFILSRITGIPIERLSKELIPWYGALMFVVFLCIFFPSIVTFIPNLLSQ